MSFSNSSKTDDRRQKVISRDSNGHIIKTFDGYVYRIFDSVGRLTEYSGNFKTSDNNSNFRTIILFKENMVEVKHYIFDDGNIDCEIINGKNCFIIKFHYKRNKLIKRENFEPIINENLEVTGYKLVETNHQPKLNPYLMKIPDYLR